MKKIIAILFVVVSVVCIFNYGTGNQSFSVKQYLNDCSNLTSQPKLPTLTNPDTGGSILDEGTFWNKCVNFFKFIFDCISYPFSILWWLADCIRILFGGVLV